MTHDPSLPPWEARSESDRKAMTKWVLDHLRAARGTVDEVREREDDAVRLHAQDTWQPGDDQRYRDFLAFWSAGRELRPTMTREECIKLAFPRGKGAPKKPIWTKMTDKARPGWEVQLIHDLWREHYKREAKRHRTSPPTAVQIAARRWNVAEHELDRYCSSDTKKEDRPELEFYRTYSAYFPPPFTDFGMMVQRVLPAISGR